MLRRVIKTLQRRAVASRHAIVVASGAALVVLGVFRDVTGGPLPAALALLLGALLVHRVATAASSLGSPRSRTLPAASGRATRIEVQRDLELASLLVVSTYAALQATGGPHSILHPLVYALAAFSVTLQRRAVALPAVALAMALEVALANACPVGRAHDHTLLTASHVGFLALFAALHVVLLGAEVLRQRTEHKGRLDSALSRLRDDARDFRLIGGQLAPESRTRSREEEEDIIAAASVDNIHQALFHVLELVRKALDLHTCVLLWLDDEGHGLRIKELSTDSDAIVASGSIPAGAGAVAAIVKEERPVHLNDPKPEHLPYYEAPQPVGAFLGVPVIENTPGGRGHLRGVLCADRLVTHVEDGVPRAERFDARDQALLLGAAREILRAIEAERVFLAVERGRYEHERFFHASELLNRALTPEQVFETAFRAARELCEYDFGAVTHYDRIEKRHSVVATVGEGAAELDGLSFGDNAGLVAMALKNRHPLPASGEWHDQDTPVFTKKARLRGLHSLMVLPLIASGEPLGAFVLGAKAQRRFPKDRRELLGVIANQVAVSMKNAEMYRQMEQMATTDGLTGLVNHRTFQERFADLLHRAERQQQSVTLLLTDVDHFKKVNDTYGHPVGDLVLKGVAGVCRDQVRKIDVAARYGGEEFAIVLDGTDREGARQLAERIRREVAAQTFESEKGNFQITISLGVATYPDDGKDPKALIANADQALYFAKRNGRNRAVAWADLKGIEEIPVARAAAAK